jgi:hypothetical protein
VARAAGNVALAASRLRRHFGTDAPCLSAAPPSLGCARFSFGFEGAGAAGCATDAGGVVDWTGGGVDVGGGEGEGGGEGAGDGAGSGGFGAGSGFGAEGSGFGAEGSGAGSAPLATGTNVGADSAVVSANAIITMKARPRPRSSACGGTPTDSPCPCRPFQRYTRLRLARGNFKPDAKRPCQSCGEGVPALSRSISPDESSRHRPAGRS